MGDGPLKGKKRGTINNESEAFEFCMRAKSSIKTFRRGHVGFKIVLKQFHIFYNS